MPINLFNRMTSFPKRYSTKRCHPLAFLLIAALLLALNVTGQAWKVESREFIYPADNKPTPECHASTVVESGGRILAAWFGGTYERHPDVGIWVAERKPDGWSAPVEVANGVVTSGDRYPTWNPVLFNYRDQKLFLFYKVGPSPSTWWGMYRVSADHGETWGEAKRIPDPFVGPIKNKPVLVSRTALLCPSSTESDGWKAHFEIFNPVKETWDHYFTPELQTEYNSIQPVLLKYPGGRWQALMRTQEGVMSESWSKDKGKTWSRISLGPLPNNNSGFDGVTLNDGTHLMVYNPTTRKDGDWGGPRYPLVVGVSADGKEWTEVLTLEEGPGEFSYPAVIQSADGKIHITYTHNRLQVAYVIIDR
ncbi:protein containing BNR repeat-like domain [Bacteroidales bacterium 6E]|nr:protein containing BNR repeat-like domain [Bacteroidales bacterium 6E]